jgi:CRP/FNR family transcriptional regulator, cyclic AMP receptor protein
MSALSLEAQLQAAGLQVSGRCDHLSSFPGLLQQSTLLQDFSAAEADIVGTEMVRIHADPGQLLIREGDASDWLMVLLAGTVDVGKRRVDQDAPAGESTNTRLAVVREGAVLGEMSMIDGEPRYASCWALSEVEAGVLSRGAVSRLIASHPAIGAKLLVKLTQLLAQRLRNTSNQLVKALRKHGEA